MGWRSPIARKGTAASRAIVPLAEGSRTPSRRLNTQVIRIADTPVRVLFNNKFRVKAELRNQGPQRVCLAESLYQAQQGAGVFLDGEQSQQSVFNVDTTSEVWSTAVSENPIMVSSFDWLSYGSGLLSPVLWDGTAASALVSVAETVLA